MSDTDKPLSTINHGRDSAALRYVYPVISRRAGGVSVGINLNPNNACNWRCIYCQVRDLKRGNSPVIDMALLETELRQSLGDFVHERVPEGARLTSCGRVRGCGVKSTVNFRRKLPR